MCPSQHFRPFSSSHLPSDNIIDPEDRIPLALRLSGQLLLGVVRIYLQKVKFLFDDCESVLEAIKQAFRTQALTLHASEKGGVTVHRATITLPEHLMAGAGLDPALLPLELNLELNDFRADAVTKPLGRPLDSRRAGSMDPSRTTNRRNSLTGLDFGARSPRGSLGAFDDDQDAFGLGDGDLGIELRDIEIETERLRSAKLQRSSERRTLDLDYDYQGGGGGDYEGYGEPEVLRGEPGPRAAGRLSLAAASPLAARLQSAQASPAVFSGRKSIGGRQPTPGAAPGAMEDLDDLLPPATLDPLLEAPLPIGALPPHPTPGPRRATPAASPAPSEGNTRGAAAAAPSPARRVLRKRKLVADVTEAGEVRTTLAGAQIKALIKDRAPLISRRGRKARARNREAGAAAAGGPAAGVPPTPSVLLAAQAVGATPCVPLLLTNPLRSFSPCLAFFV